MRSFFYIVSFCCAVLCAAIILSQKTDAVQLEPIFSDLTAEQVQTLTDGEYSTCYSSESIRLELFADDPINAVYIIWNDNPAYYTITADGREIGCGENGFLHDLVELEQPAYELVIEKKTGGGICDIYLFSDKEYPDFVQKWEAPCGRADIFLLSTHADDEYLMFGGTLPYYAGELDLNVQVAYLTHHFGEQPRPHELLDGLWAVGVENYPVIGIADDIQCWTLSEALKIYDEAALTEWVVEQFRRFRPSVVITHDKNGEYGHGAHKLSWYLVQKSLDPAADPRYYPRLTSLYGVWDVPKVYFHFWEENALLMDWEQPLEYFGGLNGIEAAELGYSYHKSQHIYGYSVNYSENWDCRRFGLYRTLVGEDKNADFMDNITPLSEQTVQNTELPVPETTAQEASPQETTAFLSEELEVTEEITSSYEEKTTEETTFNGKTEGQPVQGEKRWIIFAAAGAAAVIAAILLLKYKSKGNK